MVGHHASSSLRMGPIDDPMSVLDAYGRPWGTQNLYVMDMSAAPTLGNGNPMGQAYLIGTMGGQFLAALENAAPGLSAKDACTPADDFFAARDVVLFNVGGENSTCTSEGANAVSTGLYITVNVLLFVLAFAALVLAIIVFSRRSTYSAI